MGGITNSENPEKISTPELTLNPELLQYKEMTLENLVAKLTWNDIAPEYTIEEGAGTAYYAADQYTNMWLDSDGDSYNDLLLQIALNHSKTISPDSYTWLSWKCEK